MQDETYEVKVQAAEKFLQWLKDKHGLNNVDITTHYPNVSYLGSKTRKAYLTQDWLSFNIVIATDRPVSRVVQSVAHEFKHVHQVMRECIMYHKIKDKEEAAAWNFSAEAMHEYNKEVGSDWR